jgi:hypothetical protein
MVIIGTLFGKILYIEINENKLMKMFSMLEKLLDSILYPATLKVQEFDFRSYGMPHKGENDD